MNPDEEEPRYCDEAQLQALLDRLEQAGAADTEAGEIARESYAAIVVLWEALRLVMADTGSEAH